MQGVHLKVIPPVEPNKRNLVKSKDQDIEALIVGDEDAPPFLCGECGRILVKGRKLEHIRGVVLVCPKCGAYNDSAVDEELSHKE